VPYSTVHVGTIAGGTALNIVPERCDVAFEFRLLADDSANALLARLRAAGERLAAAAQGRRALVEIVEANRYPGLETAAESEIARLVMAAGAGPAFKAGFGSEAGLFDEIGLESVVCGPGSIDRAHKADEFVTRDELEACGVFLDRVVEESLI
jgi:acetylornithine deacetylase